MKWACPAGLFKANGNLSPRVGVTWRPEAIKDFVVRGGYGIYYNSFTGNRSASSIVGLPYWTWEALSFSALSLQRWETAWPADPQSFIQPSVGESPAWDIDPARTHEWNVSVQKGLPFNSALTVSYVGTRAARPGLAVSVQRGCARPRTRICRRPSRTRRSARSTCSRTAATSEYNGLQIKLERRFADGFSFTGSYSLAKDTSDSVGDRRDRARCSRSCRPAI